MDQGKPVKQMDQGKQEELINEGKQERQVKVKICGLRRPEDIEAVNRCGADFAGFIFFPKSFRYVTPDEAASLREGLAPQIRAVGVFVNEEPEKIAEIAKRGIIEAVQLHGREDNAYMERLRSMLPEKTLLIKAFRIDAASDIEVANASPADYILLDHGDGGSGEAFDWSWLKNVNRPFFLAGGLNPGNAGEAVRMAGPFLYALDVSSGVEQDASVQPQRWKDPARIEAFMKAAR